MSNEWSKNIWFVLFWGVLLFVVVGYLFVRSEQIRRLSELERHVHASNDNLTDLKSAIRELKQYVTQIKTERTTSLPSGKEASSVKDIFTNIDKITEAISPWLFGDEDNFLEKNWSHFEKGFGEELGKLAAQKATGQLDPKYRRHQEGTIKLDLDTLKVEPSTIKVDAAPVRVQFETAPVQFDVATLKLDPAVLKFEPLKIEIHSADRAIRVRNIPAICRTAER